MGGRNQPREENSKFIRKGRGKKERKDEKERKRGRKEENKGEKMEKIKNIKDTHQLYKKQIGLHKIVVCSGV